MPPSASPWMICIPCTFEECGNPQGLPVAIPARRSWRRLRTDAPAILRPATLPHRAVRPARLRPVHPHAELRDNTTWQGVADIEKLREHLKIDRWVVFGGSWGSTLALAYARNSSGSSAGLILRGIFLCRDQDMPGFIRNGASRLFPDLWEHFLAPIPAAERNDLVQAYYRRLTSANELERLRAAKAWSVWEGSTLTLESNTALVEHFGEARRALGLARIECHYFVNHVLHGTRSTAARCRPAAGPFPASSSTGATTWSVRWTMPGPASGLAGGRAADRRRRRSRRQRAGHRRCADHRHPSFADRLA
jgi:pimeloyl-ACP methyl ester carboxylesterase